MLDDGLANPFSTRWFSFPSMSFLAWGSSMLVFGKSVAGVRALSAVLGAGAVISTFALARELWGDRAAWFSAVALAFGHYHIHFSRVAVNNVADALLCSLALWLLVRGLRLKRPLASRYEPGRGHLVRGKVKKPGSHRSVNLQIGDKVFTGEIEPDGSFALTIELEPGDRGRHWMTIGLGDFDRLLARIAPIYVE